MLLPTGDPHRDEGFRAWRDRTKLRHGDPSPMDVEQAFKVLNDETDPRLGLVCADITTWLEAHPCDPVKCEAGCVCEWTN